MNTVTSHSFKSSYSTQGFTLVEILTVVAIVAILASIAVVNLSGARESARDKYAVTTMNSIIIEATMYRANNGDYLDLCSDPVVTQLRTDITNTTSGTVTCSDSATGYEVHATLSTGAIHCIDQTRYFGTTGNDITTDFAC